MSYQYVDAMVMVTNINGFIIKRILVDNRSSCNVITLEVTKGLLINLTKLKKVSTLLISVRGKLQNIKDNVILPTIIKVSNT